MDVLHHHDRVVDEDADREDEGEEGHAVQREPPGPRGEERRGQREDDGAADDRRFAPTERDEHQCDDGEGCEDQLLDELTRLVLRGSAVVAGHRDLHVPGYHGVAKVFDALERRARHVDGILPGLLRDRDGDRRMFPGGLAIPARDPVPDVAAGRRRSLAHRGDIGHEDRPALVHAHEQALHLPGVAQEAARLDGDRPIAGQQFASRQGDIGRHEGLAHIGHGDPQGGHPGRIDLHHDRPARPAHHRHVASAGNALEVRLDAVRDPLQIIGRTGAILGEQGQREDGDIVDSLRPDQGREHAETGRQPVRMGGERVVEAIFFFLCLVDHRDLHGDERQARA